jgi:hypothetical protein
LANYSARNHAKFAPLLNWERNKFVPFFMPNKKYNKFKKEHRSLRVNVNVMMQ